MSYFAAPYTIHFDDTMAYGSHHFLTSFKFQCQGRESLLFGRWIYDAPGVADDLPRIHLLTSEAYARNLRPARLGERLVVLTTVEERGKVQLRFCFRVLNPRGEPICCGFQTILCADAETGAIRPFPDSMQRCFEELAELDEASALRSFRDQVLSGGAALEGLFDEDTREAARSYLAARPDQTPQMISRRPIGEVPSPPSSPATPPRGGDAGTADSRREAWVFSGQGTFDAALLSRRIEDNPTLREELDVAAGVVETLLFGDAKALFSGETAACARAVQEHPDLAQPGIFAQNVLGARQREASHGEPAALVGHSFGEIAALCVGGAYDFATGVRIVCERVAAVKTLGPAPGGLLAVALTRAGAREWIASLGLDDLVVAGRNHECQTVVSGPQPALSTLEAALRGASIGALLIPSPAPFHHPMLASVATAWGSSMRTMRRERPQRLVYSPIGRRVLGHEDVADTLAAQLLRPFDVPGALADLTHVGVRVFVDCGTRGSLERLLRKAVGPEVRVERVEEGPGAIGGESRHPAPSEPDAAAAEACARPPVAIVGGGCLLPGGARNPGALFDNLLSLGSGIVDLRSRDPHWAEDFFSEAQAPDRSTSALAGLVADQDIQAPVGVPEETFGRYDRAQKLLAVSLAQCRAGVPAHGTLRVLVGCTADGFDAHDTSAALVAAGIDPTVPEVARRVGIDLHRVAEPHAAISQVVADVLCRDAEVVLVDAACASSLYGVALGMRALEVKEVDVVVAGGLFSPGPGNSCLFSQFRGLSSAGCRPFDKDADGVVFGEGAAFVVLRRLVDAERERTPVTAVLRGAGLASDGLSPSANVPRSRGQVLAMRRCHEVYALDPADVDMVEAHGTGTPVGDSTELRSLRTFFHAPDRRRLIVRSLKALLGHTGWAAGTASILATCEAIRRGTIAPQAKFAAPSDALEEAAGLLSVATSPEPWPSARRRAAVNGFGFGGADAHVVLEAYRPGALRAPPVAEAAAELVVVATSSMFPGRDGEITRGPGLNAAFARERIGLPAGVHLLPDLADDMDVTQSLLLHAVSSTLEALPGGGAAIREDIALVVAMDGKTERGVDATLRVLEPRLSRQLAGTDDGERLRTVARAIRSSGPYTLQGMMPNVAAGRAASRLDLGGPNFVVDAMRSSFDAALGAARLLLGDSARVVLVTGVSASRHAPRGARPVAEAVVTLALTTTEIADSLGLPKLAKLARGGHRGIPRTTHRAAVDRRAAEGAVELLDAIRAAERGDVAAVTFDRGATWVASPALPPSDASRGDGVDSADAEGEARVTVHEPVWVKAAPPRVGNRRARRALVVTSGELSREVLQCATILADEVQLVVPADAAPSGGRVHPIDLRDDASADAALGALDTFEADLVLTVDRPPPFDLEASLSSHGPGRALLELSMLVARRRVAALEDGTVELISLCLDAIEEDGVLHPTSGGLAGMFKALGREFPRASIRSVVASTGSLSEGLKLVVQERACAAAPCEEVGYLDGVRSVRRLRRIEQTPSEPKHVDLGPGTVIVATGGARGVTAVLVEALLRRFGCTVIALGRSTPELPPEDAETEAAERRFYAQALAADPQLRPATLRDRFKRQQAMWEAGRELRRLAALPGRFEYRSVDITDRSSVSRAVEEIAEGFGNVDLILHGAGVQLSTRLARRRLDDFRMTMDVKLTGLALLEEAFRRRQGHHVPVHALTSAYSFYGNDGQPDYGAANETLDRLCAHASARGGLPWKSIGWLAWDGIGMTRGSEYSVLAKERGLAGIGPVQGARLFLDVVEGRASASIHIQLTEAERARYGVPVVERSFRLDSRDLPCLAHHLVRGRPTLPGAFALERFVHAMDDQGANDVAIVEDIRFRRFIRVGESTNTAVRGTLSPLGDGEGWWHGQLVGDVVHPSGHVLQRDLCFSEARVRLDAAGDIESPRINKPERQLRRVRDPYLERTEDDVEQVTLSGPFDCLRDIEVGEDGRHGTFIPPKQYEGCLGEAIPALMLDAAWRLSVMHPTERDDALYVPVSVGRVTAMRRFEPVAEPLFIRATAPRIDGDEVTSTCAEVIDRAGRLRLRVENAVARRVG